MSTYTRIQQAAADHARNRRALLSVKLEQAGLVPGNGGYPINPTEQQAYLAGFQRGVNWAFESACRGEQLEENWEWMDGTASGNGQSDGWNAAVAALR